MINQKLKDIVKILSECEEDTIKSEAGNISAGRRVRKASMSAIKELKELRALILENQKS
tara:strand:+ start:1256 stop:1432 length:177 start_codon:yes stop_codon:yes gene_type:complete